MLARRLSVALCCAAVLASGSRAGAQTYPYVEVDTATNGTRTGTTSTSWGGGGSIHNVGAQGSGSAQQSTLTAQVQAWAAYVDPALLFPDPNPQQYAITSLFHDGLTVTSSTLPSGTAVTVNFIANDTATASYEYGSSGL